MQILSVDSHIHAIDHELMAMPGAGVCYVVQGDDVALVEAGTSLTVPATLAGLEQLGIARAAVRHIICTHIHMDHAGGAGHLADALPNAQVYVHSMTGEHLLEPSRLMTSVRRAVGEATWPLHGEVKPLDPARLQPAETLHLDLGQGVVLEALPTPGHSPDHLAYWERRSGGMFIGDATSLYMPMYDFHLPVAPPPAYDFAQHLETVAMLRGQDISRFYVTHTGPCDDPAFLLDLTQARLESLDSVVQAALDAGEADDTLALAKRWLPYPGSDQAGQELATHLTEMSVRGMLRYEKKRREKAA